MKSVLIFETEIFEIFEILETEQIVGFVRNLYRVLKGQYWLNHFVLDSLFYVCFKQQFFFDKIVKRTIWVKPYCPLIKIC